MRPIAADDDGDFLGRDDGLDPFLHVFFARKHRVCRVCMSTYCTLAFRWLT